MTSTTNGEASPSPIKNAAADTSVETVNVSPSKKANASALEKKREQLADLVAEIRKLDPSPAAKTGWMGELSSEAYGFVVGVEDKNRHLSRQLQQSQDEVRTLEKVLRSKENVLSSTQTALEAAKESQTKAEQQLRSLQTEVLRNKEELQALSHVQHLTTLAKERQISSPRPRSAQADSTENMVDRLVALQNDIKYKEKRLEQLEFENKSLQRLLKKRETDLATADHNMSVVKDQVLSVEVERNRTRQLEAELVEVKEQNRLLQHVQRLRAQALEKVNHELEENRDASESVKDLRKRLVDANTITDDKVKHIAKLERQIKKLEKELEMAGVDARLSEAQAALEWEKRTMSKLIQKLEGERDERGRHCTHLEKQLESSRSRFAALTEAVREWKRLGKITDVPDLKERVKTRRNNDLDASTASVETDAAVDYESACDVLMRDVDVLRKTVNDKERLLVDKDIALEQTLHRVQVLEQAKETDSRQHRRREKDAQKALEALQEKRDAEIAEAKEREIGLKRQIVGLRNQVTALKVAEK